MSAISDYNTLCQAAQNAINAGLYLTAYRKLESAQVALLRIPDSELEGEKLVFPRSNLLKILEHCRRRALEEGQFKPPDHAMRHTLMEYERG